MPDTIKNVFVSHYHKDDASVDGLANMLSGKNFQLRNSSIRGKVCVSHEALPLMIFRDVFYHILLLLL